MKKHETVLVPTTGEVIDLLTAVQEQLSPVLKRMSRDEVKYWISHKGKLGQAFRKILASDAGSEVLAEWEKFYLKVFGMDLDLSGVSVPAIKSGFDRVIVIAQEFTLNRAFQACKNSFPVYSYLGDDLDRSITKNDRTPANGCYAVRIRDRVEADEELRNLSAIGLEENHITGITLLERLVYELKYYDETGQHLDPVNITLCSGSRGSAGGVPYVHWDDG